jgi:uncharacterized membrane protein/protein-disulfide isomerase
MFSLIAIPNVEAAVINLLKTLGLNISHEDVIKELDKHPDYPSLLAVSDVLTSLQVENAAFRVDFDELGDVPIPFLAHVKTNGGDLVLIKKIENDRYHLASDKWDNHKVGADEFKNMYNGVVLTAESSGKPPAMVSAINFWKQLNPPALFAGTLLMLAAALVFHTGYVQALSWQLALLTLVKTVGLLTSLLLLVQSIDSNNPLVQVLCQTQGKTDCNAILSSKAAKAFWGFSWSEIGFFYFAGTWLLLLFGGSSPAVWQTIAVLNFISLPYTIYSIYYQWRIAKQWCVLCCAVQAILWLEFIIPMLLNPFSFGEGWGEASFGWSDASALSAIFICLLTPLILWLALKPVLMKLQTLQPLKQQLRKFKYNTELFNQMLTTQSKFTQPDEAWCIVLGNVEANNIITMITNPYCPPCAKTHKLLDELLLQRGDIQARIIFTATNSENDIKTPISRHLVALNEMPDKIKVKQALNDWYEQKQKNYETWAKLYPVALNGIEYDKIDRQKAWCKTAGVTVTPTLLLNGYRLPDLYQLSDLKYMME